MENRAAIAYKCKMVSDSGTNKVHDKELGIASKGQNRGGD
jgi:hypothetical protein